MSSTAPQALYQINRTAERLDVSRATIYRLVRAGHLKLVRVGARSSRITEESLTTFLASRDTADASGS